MYKKNITLICAILFSVVAFGQKPSIRDYVEKMVDEPDVESATFAINIFNATTGRVSYEFPPRK